MIEEDFAALVECARQVLLDQKAWNGKDLDPTCAYTGEKVWWASLDQLAKILGPDDGE